MRVVLLAGEGPEQTALCHKLAAQGEIIGVVLSRNVPKRSPRRRVKLLVNRILGRVVGRPFLEAWRQLQREYARRYPGLPPIPQIRVENVNDPETLASLRDWNPDAVLVSGTNLVGRAIIDWAASRRGILNLHTGLSPYVKGGPNCTNWCFAEGTFHLIGNTVMWLDIGIDSGPILTTARPKLSGRESLSELHWNVMEHAHSLCIQAVSALASGRQVPYVRQDEIAPGRTYYSAQWNALAMLRARRNFTRRYNPQFLECPEYLSHSTQVTLVSLDPSP
jgi:folate-dependent phosphoribosylglycinamide formyltransferase PurN